MKTAYEYLRDEVIKFTKEHYDELNKINGDVDKNIIKDLKKHNWCLGWILGEVLDKEYFKPFIINAKWNIQKGKWETIYKIKNKYIHRINKIDSICEYTYVKPTKIIIIEYLPIKIKDNETCI